jgi:hypothetical protein
MKMFGIQKQIFDCIEIVSLPIYMMNGKKEVINTDDFFKICKLIIIHTIVFYNLFFNNISHRTGGCNILPTEAPLIALNLHIHILHIETNRGPMCQK